MPPLCYFGGAFCPHFVILGALFAPTLTFWWHFLPPLCCFGGAFCPHTSKSKFSCPDRFICSLIHLIKIKLCRHKPLVVILISGWRRTVFYLISKLIILSHKFSCCFSPRLISIKAEPDGSNLRMFPKKSLKWCICKIGRASCRERV